MDEQLSQIWLFVFCFVSSLCSGEADPAVHCIFCAEPRHKRMPFPSGLIHKTMSKEKGVYTGKIEQDEHGNFFCGEYLLDYQMASKFKIGDKVNLKSVIENPSDKS